jgi:hypothetical protein
MFATFIGIGIYRGSWNCPNKYSYPLVITAQGGHDHGKLYNLMTDEGRIAVFRDVTGGAGPLPNLTHLGIFQACSTPYKPKSIMEYVRDLQISHSDSFDWVVQVVMHLVASNVANATLEEGQLRLDLRNATRQWAGGSQVSVQHEFPNDLLLGSTESKRNVRPMRGK